ncbi:HTH DNA binding domain protein [Mycobacterium phage Phantastic]|uniref:HTH DNA binding domain protein n=1 Tax=Mycobacterium phage Phantastic TaxID=1486426 RepID=A0A023W607_9CAUD|nr:HTH DNA binding protein [Mycobacterium phage Phantastic]AHY27110.1 HTH DNA binding domain protein [Mycobacterium phage Phantastic]
MAETPTLLRVLDEIEDILAENEDLRHEVEKLRAQSLHAKGAGRPNRKKLSAEEAKYIREMARSGISQAEIAWSFDVNRSTISRIVRGIYHR